ncbi:hypothetical protein ACGFY7_48905 [Streptomyces prunicolor]|uniref:hypothetical protein n=1 Tax=Streptomyces prunicolor TaxID=67348 RepID=UPI003713B389
MNTRSRIKTCAKRGEATLREYLAIACIGASFAEDPALRGLRAVLIHRRNQGKVGWTDLPITPAFGSEARDIIATLIAEVLHYWSRRNLNNFDLLQHRVWELRGEIDRYDFDRFLDEELAVLAPSDVTEAIARCVADLLLCAERLNLSSADLFKNGLHLFVADLNQLRFEKLPREEQQAHVTLASLVDENLILGFRPHGYEGDGMWNVQENQLDSRVVPTEDVAAYAERRRELLRSRPARKRPE